MDCNISCVGITSLGGDVLWSMDYDRAIVDPTACTRYTYEAIASSLHGADGKSCVVALPIGVPKQTAFTFQPRGGAGDWLKCGGALSTMALPCAVGYVRVGDVLVILVCVRRNLTDPVQAYRQGESFTRQTLVLCTTVDVTLLSMATKRVAEAVCSAMSSSEAEIRPGEVTEKIAKVALALSTAISGVSGNPVGVPIQELPEK